MRMPHGFTKVNSNPLLLGVGDRVETSCSYSSTFNGKSFKGIIRKVANKDDSVVHVEMECGCITVLNKSWLRKGHCNNSCSN